MRVFVVGLIAVASSAGFMAAADRDGSFDKSLTVSGPLDLDVRTDSGGIKVTQGSSGSLRIHAVLKAEHNWLSFGNVEAKIRELESHPPVEQNGNRVRIGYAEHGLLDGISMEFEIETPSNTQLRAHADSGGIRVWGIHGPVSCQTDSGGIEIRDVESDVHATADSGGVRIRNAGGAVFARADSGSVEALDVGGAIDAQTDSGSIQLRQKNAAPIQAKADSGSVSVHLAQRGGYDISAQTESGHISVPEMTVKSDFAEHHAEGKVRGGGPLVAVRADSGSVTID